MTASPRDMSMGLEGHRYPVTEAAGDQARNDG
jgi:hypothetical protein